MLSNYIWGNWGGDDHHASYPGSSGGAGGVAGAKIRDEEEKDLERTVHDLDELADRLLTQFPAYGTNHSQSSLKDADWLVNSGGDDDDDDGADDGFIIGENDETKTPAITLRQQPFVDQNGQPLPGSALAFGGATMATGASLLAESRLNPRQPPAFPPSSSAASKNNIHSMVPNVTSNWDYDEQYLWKAVGGDKESDHDTRKAGYTASSSSNSNQNQNGRMYFGLPEDPSSKQQQQQQWMYGKNINYHHHESDTNSDQDPRATHSSAPTNDSQSYAPNKTRQIHSTDTALTTTDADFYNSRQHWMPDQLCKECYACDTPFTVFRRRHHCRLCGQVFCSSCSAFFVPSQNQKKGNSTLRICRMCHEQVTQKGGLLVDNSNKNNINPEDGNEGGRGNVGEDGTATITTTSTSQKVDEVTPEGRPIVKDHKTLTIQTTPSALSSTRKADIHHTNAKTAAAVTAAAIPMVWMDREQSQEMSSQAHWQAAIKQEAGVSTQPDEEMSQPTIETSKKDNVVVDATKEAKRRLGLTAANHLEMMGAALLEKDAPLLLAEIERSTTSQKQAKSQHSKEYIQRQWLQKLMTLGTRCCATVEPNVKKGDFLDIRPYVKIKGAFSIFDSVNAALAKMILPLLTWFLFLY